ncbi:MAG: SurA N-terminal domain-containing protein, partial [Solirubrobacteraceae bacterium]
MSTLPRKTILESIRQKVWLIIVVIALSLLALVIDPSSLTNFSFQSKDILGKVNGTKISVNQFNEMLEVVSKNPQYQNFSKSILSNQAWEQLVQKTILQDKFENIGLEITDGLLYKYIAQDPQMQNNPEFSDGKGKFSLIKFESWLKEKQELAKTGNEEALQQVNNWNQTKKNLTDNLITNQYVGLISSGLTVNKNEVDFLKNDLQKKATINYVKIPYQEHLNKVGKITDEEIEEYIKQNKKQFKVKENRDLSYVFLQSEPTVSDVSMALQTMNGFLNGKIEKINSTGIIDTIQSFSSVKNDSLYVMTHSEQPFTSVYFSENQLPIELQSFVKSGGIGSISTAIKIQNAFVLSKIIDKRAITDSIEVSHILIGHSETAQKINSRSKAEASKLSF